MFKGCQGSSWWVEVEFGEVRVIVWVAGIVVWVDEEGRPSDEGWLFW